MAAFLRHVRGGHADKVLCGIINSQKLGSPALTCRLYYITDHDSSRSGTRISRRTLHTKRQQWRCTELVTPLASLSHIRYSNSAGPVAGTAAAADSVPLGYIPPAPTPPVPDVTEVAAQTVNLLGEPSLQSMGLGAMSPSGVMQQGLDLLHAGLDLPWWAAIALGTVILRILMFPLVIKSQKNAAHMHNNMPTMTRLQEKFTQARMSGNPLEAARAGHELMSFMQRNEIKPFKQFLVPLAQLPVFVTVFMGLRQMANLPVETMKYGGMFWFTDLTVPDPFYALPLLTMGTFLMTIELGVDGVRAGTLSHGMKWFMRGMPIIMLPFISNFPAAMLCYWFTSNTFSFAQVMFLKIPSVRQFFNIPALVKHDTSALPKKKKFVEGFKESWSNAKLAQQMEERQRLEAMRFRDAGQGPIRKTYSYDPTKVKTIKPLDVKNAGPSKTKTKEG